MNITLEIKPNYSILNPETERLNNEEVLQIAGKISEQKIAGCNSFIVNMKWCHDIENNAYHPLLDLHNDVYEHNGSLAFCEANDLILQKLKKEQLHLSLNLTPTLIEAIDIINMEVLERDLLN